MKTFLKASLVFLWVSLVLLGAATIFDVGSPEERMALRAAAAIPAYLCGWFLLAGWLKV